ncbi:GTPase HflX [Aquibium sp. A9E412]|uniref:GTPase HflX n=1 Tax=Aquibium sp. A9E412 TaxID=2976767 RepID=UPI0025B11111|nr:GTPase HflX [Aquibium sp. A9E412]MDN2564656.1 GTPase HflX [Aquibium sp. A9E412]
MAERDGPGHGRNGATGEDAPPTRAVVVVPVLAGGERAGAAARGGEPRPMRAPEARLTEAVGLADAIELDTVHAEIVPVAAPRPATLIGSGKVDELAERVREERAELVVVDHPLTPVQQRNLERALGAKVLDRTGIILEIFGRRARTKEGVLQVDLAHLNYQRGRLVRSWTHLERQRGGGGFMGGPGETQIEADRRLLQERIVRLKRELERVRRTRELHRAKRQKVPFPVVAIVGYTNAGKSTLFNRLTGAGVTAEDMLFATLDPTLRRVILPHGTPIILSDTVGFISDLPTHLVAAFRATLEEVVEADLVIHLRDISDPDATAQAEDVERILGDLGVDAADRGRVIEVWNKIDRLTPQDRQRLMEQHRGAPPPALVSAATGEGIDTLVAMIEERLSGAVAPITVTIPPARLSALDWLYRNGAVTDRIDGDDGQVTLTVRATGAVRDEIRRRFGADAG